MKYLLVMASFVLFACTGCIKNDKGCTNATPQSEEAQIQAFATANGITATKHSSGIYYEIINPGTGATPTLSSNVSATYTGKLMNGSQFDKSTSPVEFPLSGVIEGWQIGIPLIKKGGKIKLIIPSTYAYGCNGRPGIPSNAVLYFDVDLVDVK
jgi:FKBP-type peptidyl-prolyl cis-trans isomerase FkpA